jgi:integrase
MALKGSTTTASFLNWNEMLLLIQKLERDKNYLFSLLFAIGSYTGLRYSDLKKIKWCDIINKDSLSIIEGKTKKLRKIKLNPQLLETVKRIYNKMGVSNEDEEIFLNRSKTQAIRIQYANRIIKDIVRKYKLNIAINASSTHVFRKTLGRHVWEMNEHSDKSLILLSDLFNHSNVAITKRYLGIREEEIDDVYMNL